MSQILRDYQERARQDLRAAVARLRDAGKPQRVLLDLPTGGGKTTVAAALIAGAVERDGDVLFVAHRKELVDQCSARLDGAGIEHGILMANHPRAMPWARVQVASVPTLVRRLDRLPRATLIVVDEAHHARASTYSHILARYPEVPVIGLTATPWRLDNCGLGELFEAIVVAETMRGLVGRGYLVPYTGFAYDIPELANVKKSAGDYKVEDSARVMSTGAICGNVVEQWLAHCGGKRTVVFAVNVSHSMQLVERFKAAGVAAEHVDGTSPKEEREGVLRRLAGGETAVVCNVNVLTEGFDCPAIENIVLARPTLSTVLYLQMVGRGMRVHCFDCGRDSSWQRAVCEQCGSGNVKRVCRIHDHAGCIVRHGMPDADRDHSLQADGRKKSPKAETLSLRRCVQCYAIYAGDLAACPQCGTAHVSKPRAVRQVDGVGVPLEELAAEAAERQAYLELQVSIAEATGRKKGWAAGKYKGRYGVWPPGNFWASTRRLSDIRKQELNERVRAALATKGTG